MSRLRGLFPVLLATGFGVLNGYMVFQPAYDDMEAKKIKKLEESQSNELGPDLKVVPITGIDNNTSDSPADSSTPSDGTPQTWTRKIYSWCSSSTPTTPTDSRKN